MKSRRNKKDNNSLTIIIVISSLVLISVSLFWILSHKKSSTKDSPSVLTPAKSVKQQTNSNTTSTDNKTTTPSTEAASQATSAAPTPKQPTFTKSSGNNGPVPNSVNMNFVCIAEKGLDCSILLASGGKQTVLGPTTTQEDGFGKYYALFSWTTISGSYQITAQVKNSQGGVSTSNPQALEVQ